MELFKTFIPAIIVMIMYLSCMFGCYLYELKTNKDPGGWVVIATILISLTTGVVIMFIT